MRDAARAGIARGMAAVKVKVCGLSDAPALDAAVAGGAAWAGFVIFPRSPRHVPPERAGALAARLPERTAAVAVLVEPDDALVAQVVDAGIRILQLHGDERPERLAELKARHAAEVWKAIPVRTAADLHAARAYRGAADRILYDAKTPPGTLPGGMGLRFDWRLLNGVDHLLPWLLSGGLDAGNLAEAAGITGARALDVSSGVEAAPGVKDVDKIAAFLQAAARL